MALSAKLFFAFSSLTLAVIISRHGSEGRYLVKNVYETPPKTEKLVTVSNISIKLPDGRLGHGVKKVTTYVTKWNSTTEYVNLTSVGPSPDEAQYNFEEGMPMVSESAAAAPSNKPQTETHSFQISDPSPDLKLNMLGSSVDFGLPFPTDSLNFEDLKITTDLDSASPSSETEQSTTPRNRKKKQVQLPEANDAENGIEIDLTPSAAPPAPAILPDHELELDLEPEVLQSQEPVNSMTSPPNLQEQRRPEVIPNPNLLSLIDFMSLLTPGSKIKPETTTLQQSGVSLVPAPVDSPIAKPDEAPFRPKPEAQTPVLPTPSKAKETRPKAEDFKITDRDSPLTPILDGLLSTMEDILQAPFLSSSMHHQQQPSRYPKLQQQQIQRPLAQPPFGQQAPPAYWPNPQQRPLQRHPLASSATRSYFKLPVLPPSVPGGPPGVWNVNGNTMVENRPLQNPFGLGGPLGQLARLHHVLNYDWQGNDRYRFGQWRFDMPFPRPLPSY